MVKRRASAIIVLVLGLSAGVVVLLPSAHATILARAEDFPDGALGFADALSGNYLAGYFDAPILLTEEDSVPAETLQALATLKTKDVIVMGGSAAVSDAVLQQLSATPSGAGGDIVAARLGGVDRYQTAALAAEAIGAAAVGTINGLPTAIIARGDQFPDALAGGPLAFAGHFPLILTEPDSLDPNAMTALQTLGIKAALILGGTAAISDTTQAAIEALGITTERLSGADRQATAAEVANYAITYLGFKDTLVDLSRGDDYPDALAGGPEAAKAGPVPIVLTVSPTALGPDTANWLMSVNGTMGEIDALGLEAAVSDPVLALAAQDATCTEPISTTLPVTLPFTLPVSVPLTLPVTLPVTTPTLPGQCNAPVTTTTTAAGASTTSATGTTLPGGVTLPTLPITLPTLPVTLPTVPTLPVTLPVTVPCLTTLPLLGSICP